jgi:hypothetical protein
VQAVDRINDLLAIAGSRPDPTGLRVDASGTVRVKRRWHGMLDELRSTLPARWQAAIARQRSLLAAAADAALPAPFTAVASAADREGLG